jgi:hypothetical protein
VSNMVKAGPGKLPRFETEEEELRFWDEHHPADWIEGPADVIVQLKRRPEKLPPGNRRPGEPRDSRGAKHVDH